ncbi:MAG: 30S ribosome-binding factor RbfA [Gemmataceae bacterium]|nr:30S ribosome-binding factor RbfA [Gemmataceae bacterium]MCS7269903.1 30S ribosome-binding factor RbfA [Gemmataceae bacterium]MDW8243888.1 30S ribosome-binding factor RbfA [Thermogemmata sp.]
MKTFRLARVAEVIRETAAKAILFQLKDPRVRNVTVTRVEVSADLQHAKVYVSVMGSEKEQRLTMHGLKSATGFIQSRVAEQLTTRYVPRLTFVLDQGVKQSIAVAQLLRAERASSADPAAEQQSEAEESATTVPAGSDTVASPSAEMPETPAATRADAPSASSSTDPADVPPLHSPPD